MPNQIINIIRMRLGSNPKQPKNSRPIQEILRLIREQDTNPNDGRVNSLTKKGLKALVSVLSTENDKPSSYNIQKLSKSNPGSRLSSVGQRSSSNNDAIIEKLNYITIKILIVY